MPHQRPVTPLIAVDTIIEIDDKSRQCIVLIERKFQPFGWAIPGGFVDVGETLEHAAIREAKEEVCLDVNLTTLLGCYSNPSRDPRGHTVGVVYVAQANGIPRAEDDAKNVQLWDIEALPEVLAFDHRKILSDYYQYQKNGVLPLPLN